MSNDATTKPATEGEAFKSNSVCAAAWVNGRLELSFKGLPGLTFDPDKASAANRARAMKHGFEQRIRDKGAIGRDPETGKSATPEEKRAAMQRMIEHLESGADTWEMARAAGEPKADNPGLLREAIMRAMGWDEAKLAAILVATQAKRGVDETGALKIWQDTPEVLRAKKAIEAERAAKRATTSAADLVAEMTSGDPAKPASEEAPF